jgi:tagatose 1,6-diphosphate aldolase
MEQIPTPAKKQISRGKLHKMKMIGDKNGIISAAAMDQRETLRRMIAAAKGSHANDSELREFKLLVTRTLTPYTSAILLDPEYGLEAAKHHAPNTGVLLTYDATAKGGRLPNLLPEWSVKRLADAGAHAIKLLLYYDPDDTDQINTIKHAFVERVGAECYGHDIPFFLEVVAYSDKIADEKSIAFARVKPFKVRKYMQEFSKPQYGVDVLKVEFPVNMRYVEGSKSNSDEQAVYSREEAKRYLHEASANAKVPFIYLSAGVNNEVFLESLELAIEANTPFSGVLCGRATWQDGIKAYTQGGATALYTWLEAQGIRNIQALNQVLSKGAKPWWDFYGGKENIEIVDTQIQRWSE